MRRLLGGTSYANAISTLALIVALGGTTAYAATKISGAEIKNGSIHARQLAKNSVTSKQVKDHSLRSVDFAPGQLPSGPTGATGATGPKGDTGAPGSAGPPGLRTGRRQRHPYAKPERNGDSRGPGHRLRPARVRDRSDDDYLVASVGFDAVHPHATVQVHVPNVTFTGQCPASDYVVLGNDGTSGVFADEPFTFVVP